MYTIGSIITFTATYRRSDDSLVDPTSPRAVITYPNGTTTATVTLSKLDIGHYKGTWTVPEAAAAGVYTYVYRGTFDGGDWASDVLQFTVVALEGNVQPGLVGLVDLADNALTTLPRLKLELGVDDSDTSQDDHLAMMINIASATIETALNRDLGRAEVTELLAGYGRQRINLRRFPIVEVDTLKIADVEYTDFKILADRGQLYRRDGFPLCAQGYSSGRGSMIDFTPDIDSRTADLNVEVTYTGGYVLPKDATDQAPRDLPWDIEGACLRMAIDMHKRDPGIVSEQAAAGTRFQVDAALLEAEVKRLRPRFKRWA